MSVVSYKCIIYLYCISLLQMTMPWRK